MERHQTDVARRWRPVYQNEWERRSAIPVFEFIRDDDEARGRFREF